MAKEYTNVFHSKALKNLPKFGFLVWKNTIWQPCCQAENEFIFSFMHFALSLEAFNIMTNADWWLMVMVNLLFCYLPFSPTQKKNNKLNRTSVNKTETRFSCCDALRSMINPLSLIIFWFSLSLAICTGFRRLIPPQIHNKGGIYTSIRNVSFWV
jgi:hypothetical protein